jgi:hypothetical protein
MLLLDVSKSGQVPLQINPAAKDAWTEGTPVKTLLRSPFFHNNPEYTIALQTY